MVNTDFKVVEGESPLFEITPEGEFILRGEVIAVDKEVANRLLEDHLKGRGGAVIGPGPTFTGK